MNIREVVVLAELITGTQRNSHVKWQAEEDRIMDGTLRRVSNERGALLGRDQDVLEDGYINITTVSGHEIRYPVRACLDLMLAFEMYVQQG